jgi:predicted glycosyltransferase
MRFFFYSHDGFGLGHTRRQLAIATALSQFAPEASILLASGADDVYRFGLPPQVDVLKIPALRKVRNGQYLPRRLSLPIREVQSIRAALLEAAVRSFRPSVVLVDKHPFGVNGEFTAALDRARESGARAVLGLRDILDDRKTVLSEWAEDDLSARIAEYYDLVLVYGERSIFDPTAEYDLSAAVAERTHFCGYALNHQTRDPRAEMGAIAPILSDSARPLVLATAGGGEDGFSLLKTFIEAATDAPWQGAVVTGPMMSEREFGTLQRLAAKGDVTVQGFVTNLPSLFESAHALVCMGGYNTLAEALSVGVPTVSVPRTTPRREQFIRAQAFARRGLLRALDPADLNVASLRQAIQAALSMSRGEVLCRANAVMGFNGALEAAKHLLDLAEVTGSVPEAAEMTVV